MRRSAVLGAVLVLVPVATAAATPTTGFAFGRLGGSIRPYTVTVATSGVIEATGAAPTHRGRLTNVQLANLNRVAFEVDVEHMRGVTKCPKALPDVASDFIRVGDDTVRVHGSCYARFNRMWTALVTATR